MAKDGRQNERQNVKKAPASSSKKRSGRLFLDGIIQVSHIAWTLAAIVLISVLLGRFLDQKFALGRIGTFAMAIVGLLAAIRFIFQLRQK